MSFLKNNFRFLLLFSVAGCRPEPAENISLFYNLDSLLSSQIKVLAESKLKVEKGAVIDGEREDVTVSNPDSTWWNKELNIFGQLDLNRKPVNAALYDEELVKDPRSNLVIARYVAREEAPVRKLNIYYQGQKQNLRRIEGEVREDNALYSSVRELTMDFADIDDELLLIGYTVNGGQKMIFGDSVNFNITGTVIHP